MASLIRAVTIDIPVERTWAALTDWPAQRRWMPATRVSAHDGDRVGGLLTAVTGFGRFSVTDQMRITVLRAPVRCEVEHLGRVVRGSASFEVQALPGARSRLVWAEDLDLPGGAVGRVAWWLVRPLAAAGIAYSLRRFARWAPSHGAA